MKRPMRKTTELALGAMVALGLGQAQIGLAQDGEELPGTIVYDNTINPLDEFFSSTQEFGDEIALEGTEREVVGFQFETFASGIPEGETTGTLRFYENDGPEVDSANAPGTLLFESNPFEVSFGTETHTLTGVSVDVPDTFTWTVEFSGVGDGEAGLTMSDPVEVGGSFDDFWALTDEGWDTFRFPDGDPAANFTAQVTAVPEPSALALGVLGGIAFFAYRFRTRRSS